MEPTVEELRKNYQQFSNERLIKIATSDVSGLRPEAVQVLQEEMERRGLSEDFEGIVDIQRRELDEKELAAYCELIRNLPCPECNSTASRLNAIITGTVMGFVLMSTYEEKLIIACPGCLAKANKDANMKTGLFGWWGFPFGIYRSIKCLNFNDKMATLTSIAEPTDYLLNFVQEKVGTIEAYKADPERLLWLLKHLN